MIPLFHDFSESTVLVFGGGSVGARKARRFAREARVVVVSPAFANTEFGGAECVRAAPAPEAVPEWFARVEPALAVAATDDEELNGAVAQTARECGILFNRADHSASSSGKVNDTDETATSVGNVVVPATVRDDPVVVAVATGGTSPALSQYLRERFGTEFAGAGAMADLSGELRERLREQGIPPAERRTAVRAVVRSERVWKALGNSRFNAAHEAQSVISDVLSGDEQ